MNLRPLQTGTLELHFSRVFRHYIMTDSPDYQQEFNQQWSKIPYEHICASLKPRDWQLINVAAKRWRIKSCGFNMLHIIPFTNEMKNNGGAVSPHVTYNLLPYLESYIDKGYQLPMNFYSVYSDFLPNHAMLKNSGNQTTAKLPVINGVDTTLFPPSLNPNLTYYNQGSIKFGFDLMNSKEWGTIQPTDEFSFEWHPSPEDVCWRTGLTPNFFNKGRDPTSKNQPASVLGRWDGGISTAMNPNYTSASTHQPNKDYINFVSSNPRKPMPSVLVRPCTFHDSAGQLMPIVFQVLIKYHSTIEIDVNDIGLAPIFNDTYASPPNDGATWDFLGTAYGTGGWNQWSGANALGKTLQGPQSTAFLV